MVEKLRIGARRSDLALIQANIVADMLKEKTPSLETQIVVKVADGDIAASGGNRHRGAFRQGFAAEDRRAAGFLRSSESRREKCSGVFERRGYKGRLQIAQIRQYVATNRRVEPLPQNANRASASSRMSTAQPKYSSANRAA